MAREGLRRIVRQRLHPAAKLGRMHPQVLRGLRITNPALLDQPNSLKLELAGKLPSLHDAPPAPSKHLTRCLRNRVQANRPVCNVNLLFTAGQYAMSKWLTIVSFVDSRDRRRRSRLG